ncbi:MAG: T9SS type A sorting domain-containing protein, partial [Bacteroidia bacterium]
MHKKIAFFLLGLSKIIVAQTGASSSPFTSIAQAMSVNTAGTYYFNISGNSFDTQVSDYGWVLIACDFGGSSASNLSQVTSLNPASRGILTSGIINSLTSITAVGISSSDGFIDVTTTNATVISRVTSYKAIDEGSIDNSLFGDVWAGAGATYLNSQGGGCNDITTLDAVIYHPCGDGSKFHWLPNTGQLAEVWNSGFIPSSVSFNLWVQSSATVSPLPIELLNFDAVYNESTSTVNINWATSTETNNNFFTVERSVDGQNFLEISTITSKGNNGNSIATLSYQTTDRHPLYGTSYYRLKQTDFNGNYKYFKVVSVNYSAHQSILIYPNPVNNNTNLTVNVIGHKNEEVVFILKDIMGREFLSKTIFPEQDNQFFTFDELRYLSQGSYIATILSSGKTYQYKIV